jgi:hypothetical protein
VNWILNTLLHSTSVRPRNRNKENNNGNNDKNKKRIEVMQAHGFRKFFDTICTHAGMNPVYTELLMGHNLGLKSCYTKASSNDLLEGNDRNLGYAAVIDYLTINEQNRLRREVDTLKIKKSEIEQLREEVGEYRSIKPALILQELK